MSGALRSAPPDQRVEPEAGALASDHPLLMAFGGSVLMGDGAIELHESARSDSTAWADDVLASLRAADPRSDIAIGALSFRPDAPSRMLRPERIRRLPQAELAADAAAAGTAAPAASVLTIAEAPSRDGYAQAVAAAVERITGDDQVHKVVLGRWLDLMTEPAINSRQLVAELSRRHPNQHLFSVPLDGGALLLGASPELLISRRGAAIRSVPLAGSAPRSLDPHEDRARGSALLESAKDLEEHSYVVQAIAESLAPWCSALDVPATPIVISTDTMWHLASPITGTLAAGASSPLSALHLAQLLHPTPAVCGLPRSAAYDIISQLEPEDRGYLTGAVGWVDAAGDGDWAVTIRAGVLDGASLRLFAGAGIVAGSVPQSEVLETQGKLETMLRAVGV